MSPFKSLTASAPRFAGVDALRGLAMLWMTVFHFCFDLNQFGYIQQNFYTDPVWTVQRTLILSLFLFCAGMGQAIATAQGQSASRFWRRWLQVVGCAVLVSLGSWLMYPQSFIYFGVLHGIALMLVIVRLTRGWGLAIGGLGALAMAMPIIAAHVLKMPLFAPYADALNAPAWNWLGWITRKPITQDYVPLFPWLGVMWWGVVAGSWLSSNGPEWFSRPMPQVLAPLTRLGRWSLSYYLVHQPVMMGFLMALAWVLK
jgi:uncharacterized membrane protein